MRLVIAAAHRSGSLHLAPSLIIFITDTTAASPPQVFALIHAVTTSPEVLARITREAVADFEADGVCYLELR